MNQRNLIFLLIFILTVTGCEFFSTNNGQDSAKENSQSLIFSSTTSNGTSLNFNNSDFSLYLPANAMESGKKINILNSSLVQDFPWSNEFFVISGNYHISTEGHPTTANPMAQIGFSSDYRYDRTSVFAFHYDETFGWQALTPAPNIENGKLVFSSGNFFGRWLLAARTNPTSPVPSASPELIASPTLLLSNLSGFPAKKLEIKASFQTATGTVLSSTDFSFELAFLANKAFTFRLIGISGQTRSITGELQSDGIYSARVSIFNESLVSQQILGNLASTTSIIDFSQTRTENLPRSLLIKAECKSKNGQNYVTSETVNFSTQTDPESKDDSPIIVPALISSIPTPGNQNVSVSSPMKFVFNKPILRESFFKAFSIEPSLNLTTDQFVWNNENTEVEIKAGKLSGSTAYKVRLGTELSDTSGTRLEQSIEITFSTVENQAPIIVEFFPGPSTKLALNGSLIFRFNEEIASNSFKLTVSPVTDISTFFTGNLVTVSPKTFWPSNTVLQATLEPGLADLLGNASTTATIFSFSTSSLVAPKLVSFVPENGSGLVSVKPLLELHFDQAMNQSSVLSALAFSGSLSGAAFSWNNESTVLTISFSSALDYQKTYELTIGAEAQAISGANLSNKYFYSFSTISRPSVIVEKLFPLDGATNIASDSILTIPFDRAMQASLTQKAFTLLDSNGKLISGSFNWVGNDMNFRPASYLAAGQRHSFFLTTEAQDLAGNKIAAQFSSTFTVAENAQTRVVSVAPANGSTNVAFDSSIAIRFSGPIDRSSFAFSLEPAVNGNVSQTWNNTDSEVSLSFESGFSGNTNYILRLSNNITDTFGRRIASSDATSFLTQTMALPRLVSSVPTTEGTDFLPNLTIVLNFDESMLPSSVENAISFSPAVASPINYQWENNDKTLKISFSDALPFQTKYQLTISSSSQSQSGKNLAKTYQIVFTTRNQTFVSATVPASDAIDISRESSVSLDFSRPVNTESAQNAFYAEIDGTRLNGSFAWNQTRMTFSPSTALPSNSKVLFGFTQPVKDSDGLDLKEFDSRSFTTVSEAAPIILSSVPTEGQSDVSYKADIQINFSTSMATETVKFSFDPVVSNSVPSWDLQGRNLTIKGLLLKSNTEYSLQFDGNSSSLYGKTLAGSTAINFKTAFVNGPEITFSDPLSGTQNVNTSKTIKLVFSRPIKADTFSGALAISPETAHSISFANSNSEALISFSNKLDYSKEYKISLGTSLTDNDGIPLGEQFILSFVTEAMPTVGSVFPVAGSTNVATSTSMVLQFNKPMNQASVEESFRLATGLSFVVCSFSWENSQKLTATAQELKPGKTYQINLDSQALDQNGNPLQPFSSSFQTVAPPAFKVDFVEPQANFNSAPVDQVVIASFSNPVKTSSLNLSYSPTPPSGYSLNWSDNNRPLSIVPNGRLNGNQAYLVKILSTTQDDFDSVLGLDSSLNFTTAPLTAPEITSTQPAAGSNNVPLDQKIVISFNREMNTDSVTGLFSIQPSPGGLPTFGWSADKKILTAVFSSNLSDATSYLVKIGSGSKDIYDTPLGFDYLLPFSTITRPELLTEKLLPAVSATDVSVQTFVKMVFSKKMNLSSVQNAFSMKQGTTSITGSFSQNEETITFTPGSALSYDQIYDLNLNSAAHDSLGNFIKAPVSWSFKTSPEQGKVWNLEVAQTTSTTMFSGRADHVMLELGGAIYVIGGYDGSFLNDVWKFTNEDGWKKILEPNTAESTTQFAPRAGHACTVFNNTIWLTGGFAETDAGNRFFDDVWSSSDGITWEKAIASADYYQRAYHSMVVFNSRLWLIAGETQDLNGNRLLLDDCWSSIDGKNWSMKSQVVSFFPRKRIAAGVFANKIWVWGGFGKNSLGQTTALNDIWSTSDGNLWMLNSTSNAFTPRCGMAQAWYSNKFWLLGGSSSDSTGATFYNDIWTSDDGLNWYQILANSTGSGTHFSPRSFFKATAFSDRIVISGGENSTGYTNEVWSGK